MICLMSKREVEQQRKIESSWLVWHTDQQNTLLSYSNPPKAGRLSQSAYSLTSSRGPQSPARSLPFSCHLWLLSLSAFLRSTSRSH